MAVLLYYSYVHVADVDGALKWHKRLCEHLDLRGRVRISPEGLNVTIDGQERALRCYCDAVRESDAYGRDLDFKLSAGRAGAPRFARLTCKPAGHVVELGVGDDEAAPEHGATHLGPGEWHDRLQALAEIGDDREGDVVLLDVRNVYESRIGRFECAGVRTIAPDLRHFAQFPTYVDNNTEAFKDKKVMMYCTGGVRCERASSYLLEHAAAREVVQLRGGICRYLEQFAGRQGHFRGKNFVFDPRRYEPWHDDTIVGRCDGCQCSWDDFDNGEEARCDECRVLLLLCDSCRAGRAVRKGDSRTPLLCGGGACTGERIRCGCGCGPECDAGPVCRRTGHRTRRGPRG